MFESLTLISALRTFDGVPLSTIFDPEIDPLQKDPDPDPDRDMDFDPDRMTDSDWDPEPNLNTDPEPELEPEADADFDCNADPFFRAEPGPEPDMSSEYLLRNKLSIFSSFRIDSSTSSIAKKDLIAFFSNSP